MYVPGRVRQRRAVLCTRARVQSLAVAMDTTTIMIWYDQPVYRLDFLLLGEGAFHCVARLDRNQQVFAI